MRPHRLGFLLALAVLVAGMPGPAPRWSAGVAVAALGDADGDALPDDWETGGVWIDPDGSGPLPATFLDLPAMGANPDKPDIFVHIDWMEDATHSHRLSSAAIQLVVEAFANAPYVSPTGSTGINLHVDQGPDSLLDFATQARWGALSQARALTHVTSLGTISSGQYDWSAFQAIKDAEFTPTGRAPVFHYVIAAHNYGGTTASGISRGVPGSDLIVSLGSFTGGVGSVQEQAGTLMHELGHNLGLRHGGGDDLTYKPNYFSVMNYSFQLRGVIKNGVEGTVDYSRQALPTFFERPVLPVVINELLGLGPAAAGFGTRRFCVGLGRVAVADASAPIDWNCDGDTVDTNLSFLDVTGDGTRTQTLAGFNDWPNLTFQGGAIGLVTPATVTAATTGVLRKR